MSALKKVLLVFMICVAVALEEDEMVEFSEPEKSKSMEISENVSTLIMQDLKSHETREEPKVPPVKEGSNGVANNTGVDGKNVSTNVSAEAKNKIKVECSPRVIPENEIPTVTVTNSSMLLKVLTPPTTNATAGECVVALFYSAQCVFSARMAPHFNALPRVFPDIAFYAVDAMEYGNLHVRFGLVYVPNVMLFHNSKPIARFNETTLNLEQFVKFIHKFTGLEYNGTLNVTSADMSGPVPSTLSKKADYVLVLAWAFTLACLCFIFSQSSVCQCLMEFLKNTWQEAAAAQHEHED